MTEEEHFSGPRENTEYHDENEHECDSHEQKHEVRRLCPGQIRVMVSGEVNAT